MAVLQVMLLGLVGAYMASACTTNGGRGQPNIESGTVDIPIRLAFQQNPVPSASISVGLDSKLNQNMGNGIYRQNQFRGGFDVGGAAVPVLDADHHVQGVSADIDTHIEHENKVVFLNRDPMLPTAAPQNPFAVGNTQQKGQQQQVANQQQQVQMSQQQKSQAMIEAEAAAAAAKASARRSNKKNNNRNDDDDDDTTQHSSQIAGLKLEYFIAIICVAGACFIALVVATVVVAKKRTRVVETTVDCNHRHHRHHHHPGSVYSSNATILPEIVVDQKPPSYEAEIKSAKLESRRSSSSMSDFEKKY